MLVDSDDYLMLISRKGMSLQFPAGDDSLRPLGRSTSGVKGMSFRDGDELLAHRSRERARSSSPSPMADGPSARRSRSTGSNTWLCWLPFVQLRIAKEAHTIRDQS